MRNKISVTIDEDTLCKVEELVKTKIFRNRSHFFEVAAERYVKNKEEEVENE
jgi:metal-responsive CopG/Arc/MetJ family transcriptional regulator